MDDCGKKLTTNMLNISKNFGNTGVQVTCWMISSLMILNADDTATVHINGYLDSNALNAGDTPITSIDVALTGIVAILKPGGAWTSLIEQALISGPDFAGAIISN